MYFVKNVFIRLLKVFFISLLKRNFYVSFILGIDNVFYVYMVEEMNKDAKMNRESFRGGVVYLLDIELITAWLS